MGAAFFYHLTQRPLEATLPVLLEKSLAAGWRVAVRGVDRDRMEWLDRTLWQGPDDGFLPHGLAGGPHTIRSDHDRAFTMPYGAYVSEAGAWWAAKQAAGDTAAWAATPTFLTASAYEAQRAAVQHG